MTSLIKFIYAKVSTLFPPLSPDVSDPGSTIPVRHTLRKPPQPTKTDRKHPIRPPKRSFKALTLPQNPDIIADAGFSSGEMAEWLKALVLKVVDEPTDPVNTGLPLMFDISVLFFGGQF
jgi:hypothetical protein